MMSNIYNVVINSCKKIQKIIVPLTNQTEINTFSYMREYFTGHFFYSCNRAEWIENYFAKKYFDFGAVDYSFSYLNEFSLWTQYNDTPMVLDGKNNFDVVNGITLSRLHKNYIEFFHFGTSTQSNSIINWYINNFDLLRRFANYFEEEIKKIFPIIPSQARVSNDFTMMAKKLQSEYAQKNPGTAVKLWMPGDKYKRFSLNNREIEVMTLLLRGMTSKNTAEKLCLSPRTIEYHIEKMKKKFDCRNKSELISLIAKTNFIKDHNVF